MVRTHRVCITMCLCGFALWASGCRSTQQVACESFQRANYPATSCMAIEHYGTNSVEASLDFTGPRSLEECVSIGLSQNPQIKAARYDIATFSHRVPQAASLPDPMLGTVAQLAPVQTAAGEQRFGLSLSQKVLTGEKRDARATAAAHEVKAAEAKLAEVELDVQEKIQLAYFQLYYLQQAIEITNENQEQLKLIGKVVERMYRVKQDVSQQDVLNVEIEQKKVETELIALRKQKRVAQSNLALLMHVSQETRIEATNRLPEPRLLSDVQELYVQAVQYRPELHARIAKIHRDRSLTQLAELQSIPDVTLGMNWIGTSSAGISPVANGDDAFMVMASINLPRKRRIRAAISEARNRTLAEQSRYDALRDSTLASVTEFFTGFESQQEMLAILRDEIVPKAELTLSESIDAYEVGEVDMMQVVESWRKLLGFELTSKRLETELRKIIASISRLVGVGQQDSSISIPPDSFNGDQKKEDSFKPEEEESETESSDMRDDESDNEGKNDTPPEPDIPPAANDGN
ncbi:MAG: TolC family protein [Planctomycetales bacterium]|nr:TolC family protein [Planctomycetales bacterium]